jgi:O-acetyl-ADP-ribose deacetylase
MLDKRITLVVGDITAQPDVDAIVNAANKMLENGGGVCGAIFREAGVAELTAEIQMIPAVGNAPDRKRCGVGGARLTRACNLPNKAIIHAVGPMYSRHEPSEAARFLAEAYTKSIVELVKAGHTSIAFPAISCGIYGFPVADAALIALEAVSDLLSHDPYKGVADVRFVFPPFGDGPAVRAKFEAAARFMNRVKPNYCAVLAQELKYAGTRGRLDLSPHEQDILDIAEGLYKDSGRRDVDLAYPIGNGGEEMHINGNLAGFRISHLVPMTSSGQTRATESMLIRWEGARVRIEYSSSPTSVTCLNIAASIHQGLIK